MKKILDVVLVEGTDKQEFVDSFNVETEADWWNMLSEIPNVISMHVEESFIETFKTDSRILKVNERIESFPCDIPPVYSMTKTITASAPSATAIGSDYAPLQFYLDSNKITSQEKIGSNTWLDENKTIPNATYFSRWTGKHVDIVTLEAGGTYGPSDDLANIHDTHPDFQDLDNPGESRVIPMNWIDLEDADNNQITSNKVFSDHGMGVLSAAGGTICGFAKRANLRAAYLGGDDGVVECINAIISWHNNKPVNPETGVKNPTIMIGEYQYLQDRRFGIKVDDIASITDLNGTVNKPESGWGNDLSPFTSRDIIPFQVFDPDASTYNWCVVFPIQIRFDSLQIALRSAWDAGIVCITAAGNNGGVYVKESDPRYNGVYCTTNGGTYTVYNIVYGYSGIFTSEDTDTIWYPFVPYGPHGEDKNIDVAAGYNSEAVPILDGYTNRGPGIDIIGLGSNTWTSYPATTYADGFKWGMFSGTSCAAPTVVGKAACLMEKYFTYNGVWPNPDQVKSLLLSTSKKIVKGIKTTNWQNVPDPNTNINHKEGGGGLVKITTGMGGSGGFRFTELSGTTNSRAFFDDEEKNRILYGKRPISGLVYPRPKLRIGETLLGETDSVGPAPIAIINFVGAGMSLTGGDAPIPTTYLAIENGGNNTSPALQWTLSMEVGDISEVSYFGVEAYEYDPNYVLLWKVSNIPLSTLSISENGNWPSGVNIETIDAVNQRSNGWYGPRFNDSGVTHNYVFFVDAYHENGTSLGYNYFTNTVVS